VLIDLPLIDILISVPWFSELNDKQIKQIETISKQLTVNATEYLFRQGAKDDYIYILLHGQVAIEMMVPGQDPIIVHQAQPNEIIGWSSVTPIARQRTASARAIKTCNLLAIDSVKLRELCDEDHDLGYFLMRRLANIIATHLLLTRLQLIEKSMHVSLQ
jgi:CRP-like cAMP-binding protein